MITHAPRAEYKAWVNEHCLGESAKPARMYAYDAFLREWPDLATWRTAPLVERLGLTTTPETKHARKSAYKAAPYLYYLALVRKQTLDYEWLFGRTRLPLNTEWLTPEAYGVDWSTAEALQQRLQVLGYSNNSARAAVSWTIPRLLLHRGNAAITSVTLGDLEEMGLALNAYASSDAGQQAREIYRTPDHGGSNSSLNRDSPRLVGDFVRISRSRLFACHMAFHASGQVALPPNRGARKSVTWKDRLAAPPETPDSIANVATRYLQLKLDASMDRPQTVRHARDALRHLILWLSEERPMLTTLATMTRGDAEDFIAWLGKRVSQRTGQPLTPGTRRGVVSLVGTFFRDTALWEWQDVPGRPLIHNTDLPKTPLSVPRYLTPGQLTALMEQVERLEDPYQRASLLLLRWSGARRDEVRRLTTDCLDTYPDGYPRIRIPIGKTHTERSIPLHPQAAGALAEVITLTRTNENAAIADPTSQRKAFMVFVRRGQLMSADFLFDSPLKVCCSGAHLLDSNGQATVSAHRLRHTVGTQLAEGGAPIQTIMSILGHRSVQMSLVYATLSDPYVRKQYSEIMDSQKLAGPAAPILIERQLTPDAVHWLKTNFLKTELELGHCLRLPAEGPCECDLVLSCSKFVTSAEYIPRLKQRLVKQDLLIKDAHMHGWAREVERHERTKARLQRLLEELQGPDD